MIGGCGKPATLVIYNEGDNRDDDYLGWLKTDNKKKRTDNNENMVRLILVLEKDVSGQSFGRRHCGDWLDSIR